MRYHFALIIALFCLPSWAAYYTTNWKYNGNQLPLYEGGNWQNGKAGINWSNCQTFNGYASGDRGHNVSDNAALLTGTWGPDQDVTATVFIGSIAPSHGPEVELLLRGTISSGSGGTFRTYEVFYSLDGSEDNWIVRWEGPPNVFTGLAHSFHTVNNGDVLRATIVGQTITMYINGVSVLTYTDNSASKITSGNPGMGFDTDDTTFDYSTFGFTSYTASDGITEANVNHPAASANLWDVQAALNWCVNSDTNSLPAGNVTWTNKLTITNGITLIGNGVGSTIVKDGSAADYLLDWSLWANQNSRMSGIEFQDNGGLAGSPRFRFSGTDIDNRRLRVDHCKFSSLAGPVFNMYSTLGVFDHNTVLGKSAGQQVFLGFCFGSSFGYAQDTAAWGDGAFAASDNFGSDQFMFFEDNAITNLSGVFTILTMLDGHSGTRYVFRHNTSKGGSLECHGAEAARTRSGRAYEIYRNAMIAADDRSTPIYIRGGTAIVWQNGFTNWTSGCNIALVNNRSTDHEFAPFWGSDGRNPWDVNHASNPFDTGTCSSAGDLTMTDSGKSFPNYAGYTIRKTGGTSVKTVSSLDYSVSGGVATATVGSTGHGFTTGDYVTIFGADQYGYNGEFQITVVNANFFTFTLSIYGTLATPATGTIKCTKGCNFAEIDSNTGTQITFHDSVFGAPTRCVFSAGDTYEINKVTGSMDQIGLGYSANSLGGVDYPTLPGGWNNQAISSWYIWGNTNELAADIVASNARGGGGTYAVIVSGTHYNNDTPKPGYSSYLYPHPLVAPGGVVEWGAVPNLGMHGGMAGKISAKGAITIQ